MNVAQLIKKLSQYTLDTPIGIIDGELGYEEDADSCRIDGRILELDNWNIGLYESKYQCSTQKMIAKSCGSEKQGRIILLQSPGDYENLSFHENCKPID